MKYLSLAILWVMAIGDFPAEEWRGELTEDGEGAIHQAAQSEVLEVYSTKVGNHRYVSYRVRWNNADVIVSDPLATSDLKKGDTIHFLVIRITLKRQDGKGTRNTLSFTFNEKAQHEAGASKDSESE